MNALVASVIKDVTFSQQYVSGQQQELISKELAQSNSFTYILSGASVFILVIFLVVFSIQ